MKKTFPDLPLFAKAVGREIRLVRDELGLTQEQLAAIIDVERETIGNFENGRVNPSLMTFVAISQALAISPQQLLENAVHDFERRQGKILADVFGYSKAAKKVAVVGSKKSTTTAAKKTGKAVR